MCPQCGSELINQRFIFGGEVFGILVCAKEGTRYEVVPNMMNELFRVIKSDIWFSQN